MVLWMPRALGTLARGEVPVEYIGVIDHGHMTCHSGCLKYSVPIIPSSSVYYDVCRDHLWRLPIPSRYIYPCPIDPIEHIEFCVCVLYVSVRWYTLLWYRNGIVNAECILEHQRILAKYRSDTVAQLVCGHMSCCSGCSKHHVTVTCILLDLLPFLDLLQPGFVLPGHRNSLRYHYMLYYRYFLRPWAGGGCLATVASWTTNENLVLNSDFDKPHGLYSSPRHEFRRKYYGHMWNRIYAIGIVHAFLAGKVI